MYFIPFFLSLCFCCLFCGSPPNFKQSLCFIYFFVFLRFYLLCKSTGLNRLGGRAHILQTTTAREVFGSRLGFLLACIGSAVGMGNIWMFPIRVCQFGGGAFLLAYLLFVGILGFTGVVGELAFGRAARTGPMGAFSMALAARGKSPRLGAALGMLPVLGSWALAIGYSVVMGWIVRYLLACWTGSALAPQGVDGFSAAFRSVASAFGNNACILLGLALAFAILALGISAGIETANKVMMPLFFLLFLGLALYMAFQPGAEMGYRYLFHIDPAALTQPETWVYALGQAFFSLSLAGSGTLIYGSYLHEGEDVIGIAWKVALSGALAAILSALVMIPAMAALGGPLDAGGPGLMFIYLPYLFQSMQGGPVLAAVFFAGVFLAGITSLVNLYEAPIATLQEKWGMRRLPAVLVLGACSAAAALLIQGIVEGWMDFVSIYVCPLGAGLAGILFYWVYGQKFVREQVQKGRMRPVGRWLEPMTRYVFCGLTLAVCILGILTPGGIG